jgi:hypothetical protein
MKVDSSGAVSKQRTSHPSKKVDKSSAADKKRESHTMTANRKRCRFIDDDADLSGSASEDEKDEDVENEHDRAFIDDTQQPENTNDEYCVDDIKIRRSERKIEKKELRYLLEDSGILSSTVKERKKKHKRVRPASKRKIYKDDDETGWNSEDADFIASSDDDDDDVDNAAQDEIAGVHVQRLLRDYVLGQGPLALF